MFQNGPRRQGFASPRKTGAPLTYSKSGDECFIKREEEFRSSPEGSVLRFRERFSPLQTFDINFV